jgi:Na+:H+ antiporter, NhaA family
LSTPRTSHPDLWLLRFISVEAVSGILLLAAAAIALVCANSPLAHAYEALWQQRLSFGVPLLAKYDLRFWVNDGLMTIFFLLVGLEIRRELHDGTLSDPRVATLPLIAAAGGVLVPALLYILVSGGAVARRGWAIPTATDIAFALGVLSLIPRVPPALRMLLLTLAIADDVAAILIIAFFYSRSIVPDHLLFVAAGVALVLLLQALRVQFALAYVLPGALVWLGMLRAGLHPTLTGVMLGLLTPATGGFGLRADRAAVVQSPVVRVEARLHPYVAFGIMPLFAFANAGVNLKGLDFSAAAPLEITVGVVLGLVLGKPCGIVLAALAAVKLKISELPRGVQWRELLLLGVLGGIGFTMSIFIASLAFEEPALLTAAKFGVLVGSALAGMLALILGNVRRRHSGALSSARQGIVVKRL